MQIIQHTQDLTSSVYQDALALRKEVFIQEQQVPTAVEIDAHEADCIHFVLYQEQAAVATCRLLPLSAEQIKLQRMAVRKAERRHKLGAKLLGHCLQFASDQHYQHMLLGAQNTAIPFYQNLGFVIAGPEFYEAGIAHHLMSKQLAI